MPGGKRVIVFSGSGQFLTEENRLPTAPAPFVTIRKATQTMATTIAITAAMIPFFIILTLFAEILVEKNQQLLLSTQMLQYYEQFVKIWSFSFSGRDKVTLLTKVSICLPAEARKTTSFSARPGG